MSDQDEKAPVAGPRATESAERGEVDPAVDPGRQVAKALRAMRRPGPPGFDYFRPVTRFIVLRAAPGLPFSWMPEHLEGLWIDRPDPSYDTTGPGGSARGVPTGRYERRDDGMLAEVYEVGPIDGGGIDEH